MKGLRREWRSSKVSETNKKGSLDVHLGNSLPEGRGIASAVAILEVGCLLRPLGKVVRELETRRCDYYRIIVNRDRRGKTWCDSSTINIEKEWVEQYVVEQGNAVWLLQSCRYVEGANEFRR